MNDTKVKSSKPLIFTKKSGYKAADRRNASFRRRVKYTPVNEYETKEQAHVKHAQRHLSLTQKRIIACVITAAYLALLALIFIYIGKPFVKMLNDHGQFKAWIQSHGAAGYVIYVLMSALQVFAAIIPGEPFEIAAGYAFGWFGGTLLAISGIAIGQSLVFLIIRKFGRHALDLFIPKSKADSVKFFHDSGNVFRMMFILFFIPGTPKDILTYCAALSDIDYLSFIFITMIARLPSILTSTLSGDALAGGNYWLAGTVIGISAVCAIVGMIVYSKKKKSLGKR